MNLQLVVKTLEYLISMTLNVFLNTEFAYICKVPNLLSLALQQLGKDQIYKLCNLQISYFQKIAKLGRANLELFKMFMQTSS